MRQPGRQPTGDLSETEVRMDIVETRTLEGPNAFLMVPAVKIEIATGGQDHRSIAARLVPSHGSSQLEDLSTAWGDFISRACLECGQPPAESVVVQLDDPDTLAMVFSWTHRPFARALAALARATLTEDHEGVDAGRARLREAVGEPGRPPDMVRDVDRTAIAVGITGTNGKTTTTRLLAHLARTAGRHVGWSSSSGVYIDGEMIEEGDYSGPSGAGMVLAHPEIDVAILETARGGILLKGLGYESNDVSVYTNVSADHLGLNGVHTVETLARVKAVVCRVTRPEGVAVLNADDDLVMSVTSEIRARRCLVSQREDNPLVVDHLGRGGQAVIRRGHEIAAFLDGGELLKVDIDDIPIAFRGKAAHQVENVTNALGAAVAMGIPIDAIRAGVTTFGNELHHNPGRLNVFEVGGYTVVLDYAHNEAGLRRLIAFGHELAHGDGRVIAVIGTAGDRDPELLRSLGRIAAEQSDYVITKGTDRYLRGREKDELIRLYRQGASSHPETPYEEVPDEMAAVDRIAEIARPGDVFVLMFQELLGEVEATLRARQPT